MEKKLQIICLKYYNSLIAQDLCQDHYQILLIIFLKEFLELYVNSDTMIKNVKHFQTYGIRYKYCDCFFEYTNFKGNLIEYKCLCSSKIFNTSLTKS